jgi:hypothetical protein
MFWFVIYMLVTIAYLATVFYVLARFPNYTGLFWLSLREIFRQKFLIGASFPYISVQGSGARLLLISVYCVTFVLFCIQVNAPELSLHLWAILLIFALLPGVMWAGTELKRRMKTEADPSKV